MRRDPERLRALDQVRLSLILVLTGVQSLEVSQSFSRLANTPLWILGPAAMTGLFATLGYTQAVSRNQRDVRPFLSRSMIRATPVGIFAILVSFGVLGPLVTTMPIGEYFTRNESWQYLLNLALVPRLALPGVFEFNNLANVVNVVAWTLPAWALTIGVALVAKSRRMIVAVGLAVIILVASLFDFASVLSDPVDSGDLHGLLSFSIGAIIAAEAGAVLHKLRSRLRMPLPLVGAAATILGAVALLGDRSWADQFLPQFAIGTASAVLAISVADVRLPAGQVTRAVKPLFTPIFAFSFPIQQLVILLGPRDQSGLMNVALSLPLIFLMSLSFHLIIGRPLVARFHKPSHNAAQATWGPPSIFHGRKLLREWTVEHGLTIILLAGLIAAVLIALSLTIFAMQPGATN